MVLGGFVIHGDSAGTLARCLDALLAVCDTVVAVDSCSTDGSAALVDQRGIRRIVHPWRGYGAARAAALPALQGCDYVIYLDADEWLEPEAIATLRRWKASRPERRYYSLSVRDWATIDGRRFLFRTQRRRRVVRFDAAEWTPRMIVHESLAPGRAEPLPACVEHAFATSIDGRTEKHERYALLWAIQAHAEHRRPKPASLQRVAHLLRDCLIKGALLRGGADALRLSWAVSAYHASKHRLLEALRRGELSEWVTAYREERYEALFGQPPGVSGPAVTGGRGEAQPLLPPGQPSAAAPPTAPGRGADG